MRKRGTRSLTQSQANKVRGQQYLGCDKCGDDVLVGQDVGVVICDWCVQGMVPPPVQPVVKPKSDKPRGWHFKKYFEHDGVVYSHGEVVTDSKVIAELKKENKPEKKVVRKTKTKTAKKRGRKHARSTT